VFTVLMPATTWDEGWRQPCRLVALQTEDSLTPEWHPSRWDRAWPEIEPGNRLHPPS